MRERAFLLMELLVAVAIMMISVVIIIKFQRLCTELVNKSRGRVNFIRKKSAVLERRGI